MLAWSDPGPTRTDPGPTPDRRTATDRRTAFNHKIAINAELRDVKQELGRLME